MDKATTSTKPIKSSKSTLKISKLRKGVKVRKHDPKKNLMDKSFILKVVVECLLNNDSEGAMDAVETHLKLLNKFKAVENMELSRATMNSAFKSKNPTIKTFAKLLCCLK